MKTLNATNLFFTYIHNKREYEFTGNKENQILMLEAQKLILDYIKKGTGKRVRASSLSLKNDIRIIDMIELGMEAENGI